MLERTVDGLCCVQFILRFAVLRFSHVALARLLSARKFCVFFLFCCFVLSKFIKAYSDLFGEVVLLSNWTQHSAHNSYYCYCPPSILCMMLVFSAVVVVVVGVIVVCSIGGSVYFLVVAAVVVVVVVRSIAQCLLLLESVLLNHACVCVCMLKGQQRITTRKWLANTARNSLMSIGVFG